ncbi:MAG: tRNA lysidine(34) synthetase TilS, partial [Lachnospiraceae bacterium]|nr:tRNA lysidine(34) synthetase TilS [Lachnospiraceae bacterium]
MEKDNIYGKVSEYIRQNNLITPGDTIIEGISGGADSVCLLLMLEELKKEIDFKTVAVHVHHGIRRKSADKDQKFVEKLCEEKGIELKSFKKDIPLICKITRESEEECGRRIRYELFDDVCGMYENAKIAVAHHMNDQAETVLFRIIRGSGIKGLTGMEAKRDNIIRPLLCLKREEIEQYLEETEQDYRIDETNGKIEYSRNYIRKKIIPRLETLRNNAVEHINALSGEASAINSYMENKARE